MSIAVCSCIRQASITTTVWVSDNTTQFSNLRVTFAESGQKCRELVVVDKECAHAWMAVEWPWENHRSSVTEWVLNGTVTWRHDWQTNTEWEHNDTVINGGLNWMARIMTSQSAPKPFKREAELFVWRKWTYVMTSDVYFDRHYDDLRTREFTSLRHSL